LEQYSIQINNRELEIQINKGDFGNIYREVVTHAISALQSGKIPVITGTSYMGKTEILLDMYFELRNLEGFDFSLTAQLRRLGFDPVYIDLQGRDFFRDSNNMDKTKIYLIDEAQVLNNDSTKRETLVALIEQGYQIILIGGGSFTPDQIYELIKGQITQDLGSRLEYIPMPVMATNINNFFGLINFCRLRKNLSSISDEQKNIINRALEVYKKKFNIEAVMLPRIALEIANMSTEDFSEAYIDYIVDCVLYGNLVKINISYKQ